MDTKTLFFYKAMYLELIENLISNTTLMILKGLNDVFEKL